jgi:hypothetical protein
MSAPCLDCGTPTGRKPARCQTCASVRNRERNQRRVHYQGDYKARARQVRADANADSSTLCIRCGNPARDGDPWTAGHVVPGDPTSDIGPEHASCNYGAGAPPITFGG